MITAPFARLPGVAALAGLALSFIPSPAPARAAERLDRGVVAFLQTNGQAYVG